MKACERVLHVLHSMNCGGAETLIMNVYRQIDRSKVQFDFLVNCFDEMYYEKEIEQLGGRIFRIKFLTQVTPPVYEYLVYKFFREHTEYKIVHSHLETTTGIILRCAKRAGVPVRIAHSHNSRYTHTGMKYLLENSYKNYCKKRIVPNATKLFACSESAGKWLFGKKCAEAAIVKNGIDTGIYRFSQDIRLQVRKEFCLNKDVKVLGHVGRFYDQKNHLFLIDLFMVYEGLNPNSVLLLAGEGELREMIEEKVKDKGLLGKVIFLGLRDDIYRILQALDVFLLPSKYEGLPVALVEAQAAGAPCIVADTVPPEADLGCGLIEFLPISSPELWAEEINKTNREHEQTSGEIVAAGYDIKATAKWLEEFYCGVLA